MGLALVRFWLTRSRLRRVPLQLVAERVRAIGWVIPGTRKASPLPDFSRSLDAQLDATKHVSLIDDRLERGRPGVGIGQGL